MIFIIIIHFTGLLLRRKAVITKVTMELDMPENDEIEALIRGYRRLTPEQHSLLKRHLLERAHDLRRQYLRELFSRLWSWRQRRAAITKLNALDDRMLKDVGLHRSQIEAAVRGEIPVKYADAA
jgi:uncharacterized protein YjiS (DUF1127 family)